MKQSRMKRRPRQSKRPLNARMSSAPAIQEKELFADSLLETTGGQRARTASATVFSLLSNVAWWNPASIPLWFTNVLPRQQLMTFLVPAPPPPPPPPPAAPDSASRKVVKVASDVMNGQLRTPTQIPKKVQMIKEDEGPPLVMSTGGVVGGVPRRNSFGSPGKECSSNWSRAPILAIASCWKKLSPISIGN